MLLQGKVVGESIIEFELSDVIGTSIDDDVLYIKGDVPIVYSTIQTAAQQGNAAELLPLGAIEQLPEPKKLWTEVNEL